MTNRPTTTYTIRLRPIDQFFFGGETHHELDNRRQYFHRSNAYPQQTSLLGMLRHQLLIQHGLIPLGKANQQKAAALIGDTGFDGQRTDYGCIASLSPLRWLSNGKVHDLRHFEYLGTGKDAQRPRIRWENKATSIRGASTGIPILEHQIKNSKTHALEPQPWTAKTSFAAKLVHDTTQVFDLEAIVKEVEQVGIWKDREGKAKEEGYFKFVYQRMETGWAFVFQASFYDDALLDGNPVRFDTSKRIITMGAERSPFELEVLADAPSFPSNASPSGGSLQKLTLISDALVEDEAAFYKLSELSLCDATPFRHIKSAVHAENHNYDDLPDRSERRHLLRRGSVFYTQNAKSLADELERHTAFRNIGYNHFIIENP
ncbi:MAG: hypothetical protein K9J37_13685 [Saprospiraceae bacterium]|nr:hypothetical protein [Saprospiraceae bacterium]MCF8250961.1 hypothetical protein [Saprospiraceae bacterium]MCF8281938.1 hypothetical protein [Bacteroidales bacterium]MCF8311925.1 hypothetical protein [Saprospiraceae bacterium]MCF8441933.1 hypothetical protein [Saprospiraceae bacterium]